MVSCLKACCKTPSWAKARVEVVKHQLQPSRAGHARVLQHVDRSLKRGPSTHWTTWNLQAASIVTLSPSPSIRCRTHVQPTIKHWSPGSLGQYQAMSENKLVPTDSVCSMLYPARPRGRRLLSDFRSEAQASSRRNKVATVGEHSPYYV